MINDDQLLGESDKEQAWWQIVEVFRPSLISMIASETRNEELAEEIVSECIIKVYTNPPPFKTIKELQAYIYVAVQNRMKDLGTEDAKWRALLKEMPLPDSYSEATQKLLEAENEYQLFLNRIWEAIDKLPERQREIMRLRYDEKAPKTLIEIAGILDRAYSTIANQHKNALKKLRKQFGSRFPWHPE